MESLFLLIPIGIVFVVVAVWIFVWAINTGQYDNLDTEAHRILFDDDDAKASTSKTGSTVKPDSDSNSTSESPTEKPSENPDA